MTGSLPRVTDPAEHGVSGVTTFIVGPQSVVFRKDLGAATVAKAATFDPDGSWTPVRN